jgi:hypothetical protein
MDIRGLNCRCVIGYRHRNWSRQWSSIFKRCCNAAPAASPALSVAASGLIGYLNGNDKGN